jgi:hypothetical protein
MRILKGIAAVVATAAFAVSGLHADDGSQLADLQARIATLEAKMMAPAGAGDAEALTSLRKTGQVKIGGEVCVDVEVKRRDEANSADDDINSTEAEIDTADLSLEIAAGTDTHVGLNFDMTSSGDADFLDEVVFVWDNVRGSNWGLVLGKTEMPFGQGKDNLISGSFVDDGSPQIMRNTENTNHEGNYTGGFSNPGGVANNQTRPAADADENGHQDPMLMGNWQGDTDHKIGLIATYKYKELGSLEMAVFQDTSDMHEDRSADNFQSYALRLKVKPMAGLTITGSFLHRYDDAADDEQAYMADVATAAGAAYTGGRAVASIVGTNAAVLLNKLIQENINVTGGVNTGHVTQAEYDAWAPRRDSSSFATSLAFDYVTKDEKWEFFGEWIYNSSVNHYADLTANIFSVGAIYAVTPKISIIAEADAALLDNEVFEKLGVKFNENVYRAALGAQYTMDSGIYFLVEYSHEWYDTDIDQWDDGSGDMIGFRTGWTF